MFLNVNKFNTGGDILKKKWVWISVIILAVLAAVLIPMGIIFNNTISSQTKILKGVYIKNIDVGSLTVDEASKKVEDAYGNNITSNGIKFKYKDKNFNILYKDINGKFNINEAAKEAYSYGKSGNIIEKTLKIRELKKKKHDIDLKFSYDEKMVQNKIKDIAGKINISPVNANISFNGSNFSVSNDRTGLSVDESKLLQDVKSKVSQSAENVEVDVPVKETSASGTHDALAKVNTKIASFSTPIRINNADRTTNLSVACSILNGTVVMPGDTFSMNKTLGPRTEAKGYKNAPIFVNGKDADGLAGGICQVTTTVYNAALLANLPIVERHQHDLFVSYIEPGKDATISGDALDMKFKNDYNSPIYITASVGNNSVMVNFYSANERPNQRVEITTDIYQHVSASVQYVNDSSLSKGTQVVEQDGGTDGLKVRAYRKVYNGNSLVSTKMLSDDYFKPVNKIIRVGTK